MIDAITTAGAAPTLEAALRFAARRQEVLAHNIANIDTPDFRPMDLSARDFQRALGEAVDRRRRSSGGAVGDLPWRDTREIRRGPRGDLQMTPSTESGNVLFHDRNNRDVERLMQGLAETAASVRLATDLLRSQRGLITAAIQERP